MRARSIVVVALGLTLATLFGLAGPGGPRSAAGQPAMGPPVPARSPAPGSADDPTPPRISYLHGEASFWRPGAQDWSAAQLNVPLAPGDTLYAGPGGTIEVQIGAAAFVRVTAGTQLGLDNQDANYLQFRVTAGHAALDLRQLAPGMTVELDTPNVTFSVAPGGYYHADVDESSTTFAVYNGGNASMTVAGGAASVMTANQQVVIRGTDTPEVAAGPAPALTAWDRWGFERTESLARPASVHYVPTAMYGTEALDQFGTWRTVETYGAVWVPAGTPPGWVPYSTGRWIWDPRFGWTWLDDAAWGWAPYHYGRWVFVDGYWAWAPGPVVVRPVYAPALVVFLGSVDVSVERPVYWAPLAWGEPVTPWWGRPGVIGVPWWAGWGGPRVVNNVVINRTTVVNVTNITVYRNVSINNAVVGVSSEHFGRGRAEVVRVAPVEVRQLRPIHGALAVAPVAASLTPSTGRAVKPPAAVLARPVVGTRPPKDPAPVLRAHGLAFTPETPRAASRLVTPPPGTGPDGKKHTGPPPPAPGVSKSGPRGPERGLEAKQYSGPPPPPAPGVSKSGPPPRGLEGGLGVKQNSGPPPPPAPGVSKSGPRGPERGLEAKQYSGPPLPPAPGVSKGGPPPRGPEAKQYGGPLPPPAPEVSKSGLPRQHETAQPAWVVEPKKGGPQPRPDKPEGHPEARKGNASAEGTPPLS